MIRKRLIAATTTLVILLTTSTSITASAAQKPLGYPRTIQLNSSNTATVQGAIELVKQPGAPLYRQEVYVGPASGTTAYTFASISIFGHLYKASGRGVSISNSDDYVSELYAATTWSVASACPLQEGMMTFFVNPTNHAYPIGSIEWSVYF